jgi:peptidoglycan/xylan/chitin deacetylase (PgdA/CDA1 family)
VRIVALEYHDVVREGDWDASGFAGNAAATYKLSVASFDEHLAALERSACPVQNAVDGAGSAKGQTPVLLTFDDGGSGYMAAADLLERRGWRGCVFMTTGFIGKPGFLGASELRALHQRGHTIGTHSRNHPLRLAALATPAILEEWRTSIADLEEVLGAPVTVGSVPGGYHSRAVAESAASAGLTTLFTSEPETRVTMIDGCTVRGRYTLRRGDRGEYAARLAGSIPTARVAQWCKWNAKKLAKTMGGSAYLKVRERILGS